MPPFVYVFIFLFHCLCAFFTGHEAQVAKEYIISMHTKTDSVPKVVHLRFLGQPISQVPFLLEQLQQFYARIVHILHA